MSTTKAVEGIGQDIDADRLLAAICYASTDQMFAINLAGKVEAVNVAAASILGKTPQQIKGCHFFELFPKEQAEAFWEAFVQVRDTGQELVLEEEVLGADGIRHVFSVSKFPLHDDLGNLVALAGVAQDITPRKRLEVDLQQSENRFRLAMDAASEGIWDWNLEAGEVYYSPGYALMLGYQPTDISFSVDTWIGLLHPDERDRIAQEARKLLRDPGHYSLEFRLRHQAGGYRWILSKGKVVDWASDGTPCRAVGTHIDITERKENEELLREKERLLNLALAGSELGIWDVNLEHGHCTYDERYGVILGLDVAEIQPTIEGWMGRIHPDDLATVDAVMRAHLNGETPLYESEHRLRHKDGHWIWVLARGKLTFDAAGKRVRMSGTIQNISNRKQLADEGSKLLQQVESLISVLGERIGEFTRSGQASDGKEKTFRLSARNREVLEMVVEGMTSAQIAQRLGISVATASTHRRNLLNKLGLRNKAELIRYAIKHRLVAP